MAAASFNPQVSVVIPAYNEEQLIGKTLTSLANQDFAKDFEVIVVDNNSTDGTAQEVMKHQDLFQHLEVINEPRQGIAQARNAGFQKARGKLVASTDSDEILPKNWLSAIVKTLKGDEQVVACFGPYQYSDKSWIFNKFSLMVFWLSDFLAMLISGTFVLRGGNSAIKKWAWQKAGGFDESLKIMEDVEIAQRLKKLGKVVYIPDLITITTFRRFHGRLISQVIIKLISFFSIIFTKEKKTIDPGQFR